MPAASINDKLIRAEHNFQIAFDAFRENFSKSNRGMQLILLNNCLLSLGHLEAVKILSNPPHMTPEDVIHVVLDHASEIRMNDLDGLPIKFDGQVYDNKFLSTFSSTIVGEPLSPHDTINMLIPKLQKILKH